MNIRQLYGLLGRRFRQHRMHLFSNAFGSNSPTSVLDLGGTWATWRAGPHAACVTVLNLDPDAPGSSVVADACLCPFADRSFDVAFSNSVIEHLGSAERQMRFAGEVRRLARFGYFVQTPNKWFPIEPHYLAPLVQFVPKRVRPFVVR